MISQKKLFAREAIFFFVLFLREKNKEEEGGHKSMVRSSIQPVLYKTGNRKNSLHHVFFSIFCL